MSMLSLACLLVTFLMPLPTTQTPGQTPGAGPNETATQFYLRWRRTAVNAKSVDEITAFWTADALEQFSMMPDSARADTLAMVNRFYRTQTDVKVVKETATPTGAALSLEALDADKKPIVGSVDVVKENGAWKISNAVERWKPKGD
jgi:hypothetical protein